jgi:hypothetical protein
VANPLPENYEDLSTDKGYQFRFYCERCSDGFTSRFMTLRRPASAKTATAPTGPGRQREATVEVEGDVESQSAALRKAVVEVERHLRWCKKCKQWVCAQACWNADEKLCKECAPDEDETIERDTEVIDELVEGGLSDEFATDDLDTVVAVAPIVDDKVEPVLAGTRRERAPRQVECLACGATVEDRSFCSECGESLRGANVCPECDADMAAGAKFCSLCGAKI